LRRAIIVAAGLFVIVGGLAGLKFWQISTLIAVGRTMEEAGPPPEAVGSAIATTESWPVTLTAVGTVTGVEDVTVSTEQPGIVSRLGFESGDMVREGQPLVELETTVEEAQLASAKARRDLARVTAGRTRALVEKEAIAISEQDRDDSALAAAEGDLKAIEAQIEHKRVRAPFSGRAGIRSVNIGQYLAAGTVVTTIESVAGLWVDFSLPQEQLGRVTVGTPVKVTLRDQSPLDGRVTAVDSAVDPQTRNIKLRATLSARRAPLRSGMFVTVAVMLPVDSTVVVVPSTAVVHAPFGDSVFVLEPKPPGSPGTTLTPRGQLVKIARQQFVKLGPARGDFVAIAKGLAAGSEVVAFGAFKLRNGSPVVVDNRDQPKQALSPQPEDR
jgi:membrane fusion protein (multidrug efflux system)